MTSSRYRKPGEPPHFTRVHELARLDLRQFVIVSSPETGLATWLLNRLTPDMRDGLTLELVDEAPEAGRVFTGRYRDALENRHPAEGKITATLIVQQTGGKPSLATLATIEDCEPETVELLAFGQEPKRELVTPVRHDLTLHLPISGPVFELDEVLLWNTGRVDGDLASFHARP